MGRVLLPRALTRKLAQRSPEEWFLGSLQRRVLGALAKRGPSTVRQLTEALDDRFAYTTVLTVLAKLHEKGVVRRAKVGKGYVYEALFTPADLRDRMAQHLVNELVDDFGEVALAHFATALDAVDRRRIEKLRRGG
ncbi:MAG: BlaI/MecI/CopY family transcriptional regulator [Thermoleophilaceae bacterium]